MSKIYCADISCKFNSDKSVCTCKKVSLSWNSVQTVNDGRQDFHRCKTYEKSQRSIEIEDKMKQLMEILKKQGLNNPCP